MGTTALVLSDIHSQVITLENILKKAKEIIKESFIAIVSGDITNFGTIEDLASLLELISKYSEQSYFVFGNCDPIYDMDDLHTSSLHVESNPQSSKGITYVGFGSADPKINHKLLKKLSKNSEQVCLITHAPPYGTEADLVSINRHAGSKTVRQVLDSYKNIFLSISGHIHESPTISSDGNCCIVNPGPVNIGNFAILHIDDNYGVKGKIYNIHEM